MTKLTKNIVDLITSERTPMPSIAVMFTPTEARVEKVINASGHSSPVRRRRATTLRCYGRSAVSTTGRWASVSPSDLAGRLACPRAAARGVRGAEDADRGDVPAASTRRRLHDQPRPAGGPHVGGEARNPGEPAQRRGRG